ncbi:hypothetical protein DH2020_020080 [Rehmannia glutinosa]|uniref:DUF4378 domain-containing protein n=1 Tax=Rehmannia glutinosa TaxID=99300 RepID=A0ABR0WF33_REHGL
MGIDKQGSKGGNYVGGFFQMFDWNAKSRKKLFSSKSDVPEQSKQKKICDGNLPTTRLQMMDVDEIAAGSSIKEGSDYSCSSSVIDEDFYVTKAPGVVARLMGLDSLPKSTTPEHYSSPLFDSQSLHNAYYQTKSLEYCQDQIKHYSSSLQDVPVRNIMQQKYQKTINRPIEKFQTEVLPPKSAKSIPITHHKLLSPIKSANFIPSKDAAQIMEEAAARIIERGPQASVKTKLPPVGSSSGPLRVGHFKEKVQIAQKPLKVFEGSQRKAESSAVKNLRGHSMNKSWNGSADTDSEEYSIGAKNKGKSISLALQAKANVLKREGLNASKNKTPANQKEPCELSPKQLFKSQSTTQKSKLKKASTRNDSNVLRQNNQKQNCIVDRGKLPTKCGKTLGGESSSARQRSSSKLSGTSKVSTRKLGSEVKDDKSKVLSSSSSETIARKKRCVDGNYHSEKNQAAHNIQMDKNGKAVQSCAIMERQSSWDQDSGKMGTDVISFTFTAPMTRSGPGSGGPMETGGNCKIFSTGSQSKRSLVCSDGMSTSKFSLFGHNIKGGDALSTLLEQKLKELTHKVEFSQQKSGSVVHEMVPGRKATMSSTMLDGNKATYGMNIDNQDVLEEISMSDSNIMSMIDSNISHDRKLLDCRLPSPVSVLEHSPFADSCNSSDTADSYSMGGSKQCSSFQVKELLDNTYSSKMFPTIEGDAELSDSASSNSAVTVAKKQETTLISSSWELEYVKDILCNIEMMFDDYALGRAQGVVNFHIFDQLENRKRYMNDGGVISRMKRRVLFDCVSECMDMRCRQYVSGGCKLWAKGLSAVRRKERLAEEVYKEISGWSAVGDSMIDELVDKDMSSSPYGRWLDFDVETFELGMQIESRVLNSLIDEVVADILVL